MKKILFLLSMLCVNFVFAQRIPQLFLGKGQTIHFISPEPIQYADISVKELAGDLALKNVLRIRLKDSAATFRGAVVTIAGEKFMAQYQVVPGDSGGTVRVEILPEDTRPLDISGVGFSQNQLRTMALRLIADRPEKKMEKEKAFGITGKLNHIYSAGEHLFLDISYTNNTNIRYTIEDLRFRIEDRKAGKASNVQSVELRPELVLYNIPSFGKSYRNIFVFKKMSFPGNKVLLAELSEKQLSGRVLTLKIPYQDILDADTLPN